MARRKSLNRRWSRRSNASAVLDQDSNYIDDEDETYWRHLPDQTRYSNRASLVESTPPVLNSNSRFIDDSEIESTEWWRNLQTTSQDFFESKAASPAVNLDLENASDHTSASEKHSITEKIKKKRVIFGRTRRRSSRNPFSQVLESSDITVESEPNTSNKKKENSRRISQSADEIEKRRLERSEISSRSNSRYSPDTSASTDTDRRVKARPLLFKKSKRISSSTFHEIIQEDDSIAGPSQPSNINRINSDADVSPENTSRRSKRLNTLKNKSLISEKQSKTQENVNVNESKELNTQPRTPFSKLPSRLSRSVIDNIVSESEGDETVEKISEIEEEQIFDKSDKSLYESNLRSSSEKIDSRSLHESVSGSISDNENEEMLKTSTDIDNNAEKSRGSTYKNKQSDNAKNQESDSDLKLYISDEKLSEEEGSARKITGGTNSLLQIDDQTSPIKSRSLEMSSSSTEISVKSLEISVSNTSQREADNNDDLSNKNISNVSDILQDKSDSEISKNKISSTNKKLDISDEGKSKTINETKNANVTPQKKSSNNETKRSLDKQVAEKSQRNDSDVEKELASGRQEKSFDDNIQKSFTQPTQDSQLSDEGDKDTSSEEGLNFEKRKRSSGNKIHQMSKKRKTQEMSLTNKQKLAPDEQSQDLAKSTQKSSSTRKTLEEQLAEMDGDSSESENQQDLSNKVRKSSNLRKTSDKQLSPQDSSNSKRQNLSEQTRKTSNSRRTLVKKLTEVDEDILQSEEQSSLANKTRKSSNSKKTQEEQSTDKDEDASESEDSSNRAEKLSNTRKTLVKQLTEVDEDSSEPDGHTDMSIERRSSNLRKAREKRLTEVSKDSLESGEQINLPNKTQETTNSRKTLEKQQTEVDRDDLESDHLTDTSRKLSKLKTIQRKLSLIDSDEMLTPKEQKIDSINKTRKSSKLRKTQEINSFDEDDNELASERQHSIDKTQKSSKQQKNKDIQSSEKSSQTNKESVSSIDESYKVHSQENLNVSKSKSLDRNSLNFGYENNVNLSAYELPDKDRSSSIMESDNDGSDHITYNEPNENILGPSTSIHPLPNTLINQRAKSINKPNVPKLNTLERYFLLSKSRLASQPMSQNFPGQSNYVSMSQEKITELENKLKKIKEKTDQAVQKEVAAAKEKTEKENKLKAVKSKFPLNIRKNDKTPKPVNKAYIMNGRVYKQPRLPRPQKWATDRLYKFLWKKLEPKYDMDARVKSEKFVKYLAEIVALIKRRKEYKSYEEELEELIKKMAHFGIINTRLDFHHFCHDFLPYEFRIKVIPMLMPGAVMNIPFNPNNLTVPIISKR